MKRVYSALFLATFLVYSPVRTFEFVNYDDPQLVNNAHQSHGITLDGLKWAFTSGDDANWFPLTRISHMLDFQLFGQHSGSHHLVNVLLHCLATLLLLAFLHRATGAVWRSAAVAFIFAMHPLHVESVAWVAERKDVLSACFWFLTLWSYVRFVERPGNARYLFVIFWFCLGLMAKPMTITVPLVLLLLDIWPLKRRAIWEKLPFFLLSGISAIITYSVQKQYGSVDMLHPLGLRVENALVSYVLYTVKMFWPTRLALLYPYPPSIAIPLVAGAGLIILGISVLIWRSRPYLAVGWFWYLGTLIPVIGLVQVGQQARADRYTYIPMIGLSIMLAWGLAEVLARWPRLKPAVLSFASAAGLLCMIVTFVQVQYWRNSESLFRHAIAVTEGNYMMHFNLGLILLKSPDRASEGIAEFHEGLRINPDSAIGHYTLAAALAELPDHSQDAIGEYQAALRLTSQAQISAQAHNGLGAALAKTPGGLPEAIEHFYAALRIQPDFPDAHLNLAAALDRAPGRLLETIGEYQAILQFAPDSADVHTNLAAALLKIPGRLPEAIEHYRAALRLMPDSAEAHYNLGTALAKTPDHAQEAIPEYEAAVRLRPDYVDAHINLGVALAQVVPPRLPEAAAEFQAALRVAPDSARAHTNLGVVLARTPGRMPEAISEFEAAFRISGEPLLERQVEMLRAANQPELYQMRTRSGGAR